VSEYRSLNSKVKKQVNCVAIAPSTIQEAGYGLFAKKPLTEGSYPCSFGKCFKDATRHIAHNDTVYDDGTHMSIGNRNEDYGCWCNDPLDQSLVNCTITYDGESNHRLRLRWDVAAGEEIFIDYGEEFWKEHYWKAPDKVKRRYPDLIPTHAAPAEGEDHRLRTCGEIEDVFKFPKSFTEASTRQWKAPLMKKRKASSECAKRVARIVCSRYAIEKLGSMAEAEIDEYIIAGNIRKLRQLMIPVKRGGKRATVQFQDDLDRMEVLKAQLKRAKIAMSKRGVKRDNPTENRHVYARTGRYLIEQFKMSSSKFKRTKKRMSRMKPSVLIYLKVLM
jgi:hypothetical protein